MGMRWWEHSGLDMAGARETETAAEEADKDELEE